MTTITISNPLIETFFTQNFSGNTSRIGEFISGLVEKEMTIRSIKKGMSDAVHSKNLEDFDTFLASQR